MSVDAGETCCANQLWTHGTTGIAIHLGGTAFRCETQVGHIYLVPLPLHTHQAILRLDVSMDDIIGVDILQATNELVGKHQHRFEREFATAKIEKILQTWAQQIKHHGIVFALGHISVNLRNTGTARKRSIQFGLTFEEGRIDGDVFEFDSNFVTGICDVGTLCAVNESHEATMTRCIYYYLYTHPQSCHHRSYFADDIYRPRVNPDVDEVSVYALLVLQT